jgi:hypothetical protein
MATPSYVNPPSWYTPTTPGAPVAIPTDPTGAQWVSKRTTPQDYFQRYLYNKMIPYLDPTTQATTAQWLARSSPEEYGKYAQAAAPLLSQPMQPTAVSEYVSPERIGQYLGALDYNKLVTELPDYRWRAALQGQGYTTPAGGYWSDRPGEQTKGTARIWNTIPGTTSTSLVEPGKAAGQDLQAGINWLTEALRTAQTGAGVGATRAEQNLSKAHLATLYREAEQEPQRAGKYKTMFENLVNPVATRAPLSGFLGTMRTTQPRPEFQRMGVAYRNPGLT